MLIRNCMHASILRSVRFFLCFRMILYIFLHILILILSGRIKYSKTGTGTPPRHAFQSQRGILENKRAKWWPYELPVLLN
jgi:hypothetical protein